MHKKFSNNNNNDDNGDDSKDKTFYSSYCVSGTILNTTLTNPLNLYVTETGAIFKPMLHKKETDAKKI